VLRINQTVSLSVWGKHGPTVVRIEESAGAVHVNIRVGSVMSLLDTATGRVFTAFLPPKMIENFMESASAASASVTRRCAR
jgi:DNA-binding IclR family transcriptional regulator